MRMFFCRVFFQIFLRLETSETSVTVVSSVLASGVLQERGTELKFGIADPAHVLVLYRYVTFDELKHSEELWKRTYCFEGMGL